MRTPCANRHARESDATLHRLATASVRRHEAADGSPKILQLSALDLTLAHMLRAHHRAVSTLPLPRASRRQIFMSPS